MSLAEFELHLNDPAPCFHCYNCFDRDEKPVFVARIRNRINSPADSMALSTIDLLLGASANAIKQFYAKHDGVLMYEDSQLKRWSAGTYRAAGIKFFRVNEWREESEEMRRSLVSMGWDEKDMPDWLRQGIAFGEIPQSANYFVIYPSSGSAAKVYYADHDDFQPNAIADSFEEFLRGILDDPADFLYRMGCYTVYSDGKTNIEWIPRHYVAKAD